METTFRDVLEYVTTKATTQEVKSLFEAGNRRIDTMRKVEASLNLSLLQPGDTVELRELRPQYLNGMTGTVKGRAPSGKDAFQVELTRESSSLYRYKKKQGFGDEPITIGIPASCLTKVDS